MGSDAQLAETQIGRGKYRREFHSKFSGAGNAGKKIDVCLEGLSVECADPHARLQVFTCSESYQKPAALHDSENEKS